MLWCGPLPRLKKLSTGDHEVEVRIVGQMNLVKRHTAYLPRLDLLTIN